MIVGGHIIIASSNDKADQALFRDVFKLPNVDAGGGYIIFGMPPCEVAIHAGEGDGVHRLILMCDDMQAFRAEMEARDIETTEPSRQSWGLITNVTLPGGGTIGVYQPSHKHPKQAAAKKTARKAAPKRKKVAAKKAPARKAKKKAKRR